MQRPLGPRKRSFLNLRTINWIFRPLELLDTYAQRYGDPFSIGGDRLPLVVYFSHPEAIRQIFTADPELFISGRENRPLLPIVGENSLILLDGEPHQRQRRLLTPPFHGERIRTYSQLICDITEQVMSQWRIGEPFYIRSSMQEISLRVILSAVFGLHEGQRFEQLRQLLTSLLDEIGSPMSSSLLFFRSLQKDFGPRSPWGRFVRKKQLLDQLLYAEIGQRREQADCNGADILTLLMSARDEMGQPLTDVELRDQLLTLLFAGHETTASALTWAFYWIDHLPEVGERLTRELDELAHEKDKSVISRLPYLGAVVSETLRIYPIAMTSFARILQSPFKVMGYQFESGTALVPVIYLTHRRADIYPEPGRFRPERFLERQFSPYEYLPFGGGNRRCIGAALAQLEMKLVLATILSRFQLSRLDGRPVKPVRRGVTVAPPSSMRMVASTRQPQKTPVRLF